MSVLFINACVRENSRTLLLAKNYLKGINAKIEEVDLNDIELKPLERERLKIRDELIASGRLDDEFFAIAKQFANADEIVIATPFWDLSFPSILKIYFENLTVSGITFKYNNGKPVGLCRAKKLTYITTSGGTIFMDFGYSYVKAIATAFFGIGETTCYKVENLDVKGIDGEAVLNEEIIEVK